MTKTKDLIPGAFYWVIPENDPDIEPGNEWEAEMQPARFVRLDERGEPVWNCLAVLDETDWPMKWIGPRIDVPGVKETDR